MRPNQNVIWGHRLDELQRLVNEGLSASGIARRMGTTRNAVIGACHRWDIAKRQSPPAKAEPAPVKPKLPEPAGRPGQRCVTPGCRNLSVGWHGRCSVCNADELAMRRREGAA